MLSHNALPRYAMIAIFSRGVAVAAEQHVAVTSSAIPPAQRDPAAATVTVPRLQNLKQPHTVRKRIFLPPPV